MNLRKTVLYWAAAAAVVVLTFWFGYFHKSAEKVQPAKKVPVEVESVGVGSIEETIELTGWVQANRIVDIKSKVAGRIESLEAVGTGGSGLAAGNPGAGKDILTSRVEEGLRVSRNQQLGVIDHDIYAAQVAVAEADLRARQVELADGSREKERMASLYKQGSTTEQSRDKAVTAAELAQARVAAAKANLDLAQINLKESTIRSPINGVVTKRHIDEGNLISAGTDIVTIADIETVKIVVAAAERYAEIIEAGTAARMRVDAYPERVFDARVYSIHPALDAETGSMPVEIRLDNKQLLLRPGMFARVTLITRHKDDVVVIGRDVVLGGKVDPYYVYVVEDEVAHKRFVDVGIKQGDRYQITEGLKPGESLVVNGMNYLIDGVGVEVVRIEDIGVR